MSSFLNIAREVIRIEAEAVAALESRIDANFERAVNLLFDCKGRVIVSGIGKSGIIAQKIARAVPKKTKSDTIFRPDLPEGRSDRTVSTSAAPSASPGGAAIDTPSLSAVCADFVME